MALKLPKYYSPSTRCKEDAVGTNCVYLNLCNLLWAKDVSIHVAVPLWSSSCASIATPSKIKQKRVPWFSLSPCSGTSSIPHRYPVIPACHCQALHHVGAFFLHCGSLPKEQNLLLCWELTLQQPHVQAKSILFSSCFDIPSLVHEGRQSYKLYTAIRNSHSFTAAGSYQVAFLCKGYVSCRVLLCHTPVAEILWRNKARAFPQDQIALATIT